jgi:hypothetical protein
MGMFKPFLLLAFFGFVQSQEPAKTEAPTGIIAGTITMPEEEVATQPIQVILLSNEYSEIFSRDVQMLLDQYWERYKPAFAQRKEFFFEVSVMAQRDAIQRVVTRMRRDMRNDVSGWVKQSSPEGKFEFKNVPFGDYKVVAVGKAGQRDLIWQDSVAIKTPIPQFLELKNRKP